MNWICRSVWKVKEGKSPFSSGRCVSNSARRGVSRVHCISRGCMHDAWLCKIKCITDGSTCTHNNNICVCTAEETCATSWRALPVLWAYKSLTWSSQCVQDHRSWPSGLAATPCRHRAATFFQTPRPQEASVSYLAAALTPDQSHWLPQWPWVLRLGAAAAWSWYLAPLETALVSGCSQSLSAGAPQHSGRSQPLFGCPENRWQSGASSSCHCQAPWVHLALLCAPHSQQSPPSQGSSPEP